MKTIFRALRRQIRTYPFAYSGLGLLILLTATMWIAEPLYASFAINKMLATGPVNYALLFSLWLLLFVVISAVQTVQKFVGWKVTEWLILDHREFIYGHVLRLGIAFHTRQKSGEVIKILDNASDTLADLQRELLIQLIPSFLSAFVFLVIGFTISPILSSVLLLSICLYMVIAFTGTRKTAGLQQQVNELWVESIGRAYDAVTNIFSVKSAAQEQSELEKMHEIHRRTYTKQQQVNRRWAAVEAINFFMLTRILLVAIGIYMYAHGILSLGFVYFFQASFFRVLTPFEMLGSMLPQWNKQVGRVRLAEELLSMQIDVQNKPNAVIPADVRGAIHFDHVRFSYAPERQLSVENDVTNTQDPKDGAQTEGRDAPDVLRDITLDVQPGEHIAFVGHSGAGKSTIAMLLNRFYDVTAGSISVDGVDMRDLDVHWWRSQIGLVLQDNIMFNDSILENIRYARQDASDEEVRQAATRAAADEFIQEMPNGYQTLIGDRGIRLSGGQRQRVAIARAILKNPKVVVLDEATSALDSVTERTVQEGIKELITGRTSFIIAHRLSTVRSVDRIAMVEDGRITACAPHEELMKISAAYKEMVELQHQGMLAE